MDKMGETGGLLCRELPTPTSIMVSELTISSNKDQKSNMPKSKFICLRDTYLTKFLH
jgi:hypothetical protein